MVGRNGLTSRQFVPSRLHVRRMGIFFWIGPEVPFKLLVGSFIYFKESGSTWEKIYNKEST